MRNHEFRLHCIAGLSIHRQQSLRADKSIERLAKTLPLALSRTTVGRAATARSPQWQIRQSSFEIPTVAFQPLSGVTLAASERSCSNSALTSGESPVWIA